MSRRRLPPRVLESVLRAFVPPGPAGLSIVGDLREEFANRGARSHLAATLWYAWQTLYVSYRLFGERRRARYAATPTRFRSKGEPVSSLLRDLRQGVRSLMRTPVYAGTAILTLALGVGATTAVFSVVNGVLLRPLPYHEPDALVDLSVNTGGDGWYGSSIPEFFDYEEHLGTLGHLAGWQTGLLTVGDSTRPRRIDMAFVTQQFFPALGVPPLLGRVFVEQEDSPGSAPVVVLSEALWREEFGGSGSAIGQSMVLSGTSYTIIGVMPDSVRFPTEDTRLWVPYPLNRASPPLRANHVLNVVGRLEPGVPIARARAELASLAERLVREYPQNYGGRGYRARLLPLHEYVVGNSRVTVLVVFGAVVLVLLIASVNVVSLVLARGHTRRREVAIRTAVGAARGRLVRLFMGENALLALSGGLIGALIAWFGVRILVAAAPTDIPRLADVAVNTRVFAFAGLLVLGLTFVLGLWPAFVMTGGDVRSPLTDGGRGTSSRHGQGLRRGLVIVEVALAATLAMGAGVMIRTLHNLYAVDGGFSPQGVLTFRLDPPFGTYTNDQQRVALYDELERRLAALPGVSHVGSAGRIPFRNTLAQLSLRIEGQPVANIGEAPDAYQQVNTPGYFAAMGIRPMRGRLFTDADRRDTPPVAVINETMARLLWPGDDAVGKRFRMFSDGWPMIEVVGIIPDVTEMRLDQEPQPRYYIPYAQSGRTAYFTPLGLYVMIKVDGEPTAALAAARSVVARVDPIIPVSRVAAMSDLVRTSVASQRFARTLLQIMGAIALFLAGVGVYGVVSMSVAQRVPEIGLRKALGARDATLLATVLRESLALTVLGAVIGIPAGMVLTRTTGSLVFGVGPFDMVALSGALFVLAMSGLASAAVPALRASRIDPIIALRSSG